MKVGVSGRSHSDTVSVVRMGSLEWAPSNATTARINRFGQLEHDPLKFLVLMALIVGVTVGCGSSTSATATPDLAHGGDPDT